MTTGPVAPPTQILEHDLVTRREVAWGSSSSGWAARSTFFGPDPAEIHTAECFVSGGSMAWKQITEQTVVAHVGGKVRAVLVVAWDTYTGAVKVEWPPPSPALAVPHPYSHPSSTRIEKIDYEPLDPDGFRVATSGF